MEDDQFKDLVIRKLEKIEEKQETRHDKLHTMIHDVRDEQMKNSMVLSQMKLDIPEIKKDLFEHKEGVIQNRTRIKELEEATRDQESAINESVQIYKDQVSPVIKHVENMQAMPEKIRSFIIKTSKVMGAIALILASTGSILAYFMKWF